jgi:hypothetical protein
MSNIAIPNLPAATSLSGAELVLGVQSNASVKVTTAQIASYSNSLLTYVSSIGFGTTGLTPVAGSTGTITVAGTLNVSNGGTGATSSTGSGSVVLSNSPTLVTPNLGTPSAINLTNATGLPASAITGVLPTANGGTALSTFTAANNAIYSTSASVLTAGTLPVLAGGTGVTTKTGTGSVVLSTTPTLVTPVLGVATATSINGATITTTTGTLTLANGSTLATSGAYSVTLTAGASTNVTLPASGYVITSATNFTNPVTGTPNSGTYLRGDGTWATVSGSGSVTSVGQTFTGGLISVAGSPVTGAGTLALTVAGTSGGIPYFSSASTWASSAVLAANAIVIGGGAGATPATTTTGTGVLTAIGNAVNTSGGLATSAVTALNSLTSATSLTTLASLATVGTITSGTWNGSVIGSTYGGTGVNNGSFTITLGGNLTTTGAFNTSLAVTGATSLTLPTSGYVISSATNFTNPVSGTPSSTTYLRGDGTWATAGGVTSVGFTGGIISVATATTTPAFTVAGTSGGIPYFSSGTTWATSGVLTSNAIVVGGGAGVAPSTVTTGTGVLTAIANAVNTSGGLATSAVTSLSSLATVGTITTGAWNGTVGATTASTGAFTTLSASSTVSGAGFSTYLASPPAIGGTTAAAGTFTTVIGTSSISSPTITSTGSSSSLNFQDRTTVTNTWTFYSTSNIAKLYSGISGATGDKFTFDSSGNFVATGNVTAYSDERVKTNWRDFSSDTIANLARVKSGIFDRTDQEMTQVGVSAQSLRKVLPDAILEDADGRLSVSYGNAAMASVIELCKEVVMLRARLEAVESRSACRCGD